ncbi:dicarboxylate/amino acid:cation symporter [Glaciecola petra]|uniref:Dicarboxylate/amino acid:cation symporter n=1 Tax=Glaciecola petra TaxID=3075602 RepID=A0ABU2ZPL0_9ALTE|nr:dicarboxylate/amino acid:cation symporter [Aestuariibacter sp. P117]MDT0594206.1 dicarboxylate/amino acid:cation symporter [Aestuariibacter sp. P117]
MSNPATKSNLTVRILIGMLLGIIIGVLLQWSFDETNDRVISLFGLSVSFKEFFVLGIFDAGGQIFVNLLRMLVVPLVFVSLVCGVSSLSDPSKLGRLGGKSLFLYILTTCIAVTFALIMALIIQPGEGFTLPTETVYEAKEAPGLAQVIINMFPSNPIAAMADGNMLQIIVFSLLVGFAITKAGDAGKKIQGAFEALNEVIMKIVIVIMNIAPYGVFFLMAELAASVDINAFGNILQYFFLVFFLLILHALITYPVLLSTLARLNPLILLIKMKDTAIFAFSSSSSSATLPVTMATARNKLGVDKSVASFTIPLGATINMDGTAIMQGVATVFIAQVYGVDLSTTDLLMVVLTATLASVGTAGVPGVGLIMLAMVLQQVNLPVEGIALIIGIDRLLDMTRTVVNVTGDSTIACIVAKSENQLDKKMYNNMDL